MHHEDWLYFCPLEDHVLYEFTLSSISLPPPSILSTLLGNQNLRLGLQLCLSLPPSNNQCHLCIPPKPITVGYFALHKSMLAGEVTSYTLHFWDKSLWILKDNWDLSLGKRHFTFHLLFLFLSLSVLSSSNPWILHLVLTVRVLLPVVGLLFSPREE